MLKIYYNEESNADYIIHLTIRGDYCKAECSSNSESRKGTDVIETLHPYNSYVLTEGNGTVKLFRRPMASDYRFLDLNRLGVSIKLDFAVLTQLYGNTTILDIDTGIMAEGQRDIVVRMFNGQKENLTIDTDQVAAALQHQRPDPGGSSQDETVGQLQPFRWGPGTYGQSERIPD